MSKTELHAGKGTFSLLQSLVAGNRHVQEEEWGAYTCHQFPSIRTGGGSLRVVVTDNGKLTQPEPQV
jgi:hypothetical protein